MPQPLPHSDYGSATFDSTHYLGLPTGRLTKWRATADQAPPTASASATPWAFRRADPSSRITLLPVRPRPPLFVRALNGAHAVGTHPTAKRDRHRPEPRNTPLVGPSSSLLRQRWRVLDQVGQVVERLDGRRHVVRRPADQRLLGDEQLPRTACFSNPVLRPQRAMTVNSNAVDRPFRIDPEQRVETELLLRVRQRASQGHTDQRPQGRTSRCTPEDSRTPAPTSGGAPLFIPPRLRLVNRVSAIYEHPRAPATVNAAVRRTATPTPAPVSTVGVSNRMPAATPAARAPTAFVQPLSGLATEAISPACEGPACASRTVVKHRWSPASTALRWLRYDQEGLTGSTRVPFPAGRPTENRACGFFASKGFHTAHWRVRVNLLRVS